MAALDHLSKYKNHGLLIIRLGLGLLFIYYGLPKLLGGPERWARLGTAMNALGIYFFPAAWGFLSAITETVGGILLIAGWLFRPVCMLLCINMIVAVISIMRDNGSIFDASHAIEDAVFFAGLIFIGPGLFSVDKK